MTLFLGIVAIILWTLLVLFGGYSVGKQEAEKNAEALMTNSYATFSVTPEIPKEEIEDFVKTILNNTQNESTYVPECKFTNKEKEILDILWAERNKRDEEGGLTGRMTAVEDRVKRVERKTGMSV